MSFSYALNSEPCFHSFTEDPFGPEWRSCTLALLNIGVQALKRYSGSCL